MSAIPTKARDTLKVRDQLRCQRCGGRSAEVHHRQRRREGGHQVDNLISLCSRCHQWVHANPMRARAAGLIVPTWVTSVSEVPVRCVGGVWWLLDPMGGRKRIVEALALELLAAFGMLSNPVDLIEERP